MESEISRDITGVARVIRNILKVLFARSTEHGARTLYHAATQGSETHGQYLSNCEIYPTSPFVLSPIGRTTQDRVWDELTKKYETIRAGIASNL